MTPPPPVTFREACQWAEGLGRFLQEHPTVFDSESQSREPEQDPDQLSCQGQQGNGGEHDSPQADADWGLLPEHGRR
jgi:hypothetical protein